MDKHPSEPLTFLQYATRRGVTPPAVFHAQARGRLVQSVSRASGQWMVIDPDLADREWDATLRQRQAGKTRQSAADDEDSPAAALVIDASGTVISAETLIEAQRLATLQRERKLRLENDVTESRLIPVERLTKEAFEAERIIRESILNLPARIAGELHAEQDFGRFYVKLDQALREALNLASDTLLATAHG